VLDWGSRSYWEEELNLSVPFSSVVVVELEHCSVLRRCLWLLFCWLIRLFPMNLNYSVASLSVWPP
jgi:hypothetical protein